MKLIFCPECHDIVRLFKELRYCKCRKAFGCYKADGLHAVIGGTSVPIAILNRSFSEGYRNWQNEIPTDFRALFISQSSDRVKVIDNVSEAAAPNSLTGETQ